MHRSPRSPLFSFVSSASSSRSDRTIAPSRPLNRRLKSPPVTARSLDRPSTICGTVRSPKRPSRPFRIRSCSKKKNQKKKRSNDPPRTPLNLPSWRRNRPSRRRRFRRRLKSRSGRTTSSRIDGLFCCRPLYIIRVCVCYIITITTSYEECNSNDDSNAHDLGL